DSTTIDFIGTAGRDLLALPVEAGFAVRGGLSQEAALDAMTIVPARMLGIDHRVGSLEKGKDCDAIVTDGDILHYQTFVQYKLVYDKEKELYCAHIRPRRKKPEPPAAEPKAEEKPAAGEKKDEKKDDKKDEKKSSSGGDEKKSEEKKDG